MNAVTRLYCGNCGKRCGVAYRDDDRHVSVDIRHSVAGRDQQPPGRPAVQFESDAVLIHDLAAPAEWPMTWPCWRCGTTVRLDQDTARRVGTARRLIVR